MKSRIVVEENDALRGPNLSSKSNATSKGTYPKNGLQRRRSKKVVDPAITYVSLYDPALISFLEVEVAKTGRSASTLLEFFLTEAHSLGYLEGISKLYA